jgi:hypothetical protein
VAVSGGYAYVADGPCLRIVNVANPSAPTEAGFYDTPGYACGVTVEGSYAYVADGDGGPRILDVSDPSSPTEAGFFQPDASACAVVALSDTYA